MELRWSDEHRTAAFKYAKGSGLEEDLASKGWWRPLRDGSSPKDRRHLLRHLHGEMGQTFPR